MSIQDPFFDNLYGFDTLYRIREEKTIKPILYLSVDQKLNDQTTLMLTNMMKAIGLGIDDLIIAPNDLIGDLRSLQGTDYSFAIISGEEMPNDSNDRLMFVPKLDELANDKSAKAKLWAKLQHVLSKKPV